MVKLKTGDIEISAETPEKLAEVAKKLGIDWSPKGWYWSESYGGRWLEIKDMNPNHINNAIFKAYRAWLDDCQTLGKDGKYEKMMAKLAEGPTDSCIPELLKGLVKHA